MRLCVCWAIIDKYFGCKLSLQIEEISLCRQETLLLFSCWFIKYLYRWLGVEKPRRMGVSERVQQIAKVFPVEFEQARKKRTCNQQVDRKCNENNGKKLS